LPEYLGRPAVIEISLTSLVAGTKYRGEFEERLEAVVREAFDEGTLTDAQGKKCDFQESVHFKPLGMETAREVLGKLMEDFNKRLADKGIKVELTASAEELILREGYSEQYGARNLERAVDRLLGTLIAEALLSGKIAAGQTIQLEAHEGRIQFCHPTAS
jgi:ATP-dependent Clp protease ATP-binding subunit ClpA